MFRKMHDSSSKNPLPRKNKMHLLLEKLLFTIFEGWGWAVSKYFWILTQKAAWETWWEGKYGNRSNVTKGWLLEIRVAICLARLAATRDVRSVVKPQITLLIKPLGVDGFNLRICMMSNANPLIPNHKDVHRITNSDSTATPIYWDIVTSWNQSA